MNYYIVLILNLFIISKVVFCDYLPKFNATEIEITDEENEIVYSGLQKTIGGQVVSYFLGIRYAEPPVGKLRFKRPVAAKYRSHIDATRLKQSCYQSVVPDPMGASQSIYKTFSEDCLHLNVWSPEIQSDDSLKTVMVYLYGGGFIAGTISSDVNNCEMLSAVSDVVVVTINYRTNIFGFLYSGTPEAPGNVGLWDQVLALEWIQEHIKAFGGDPTRVTLYGLSAGAMSVSLHILSPISRHLFRNAILISGSALSHLSGDDPQQAIKRWTSFSQELNCTFGTDICDQSIHCLRQICAQDLFDKFMARRDFISDLVGFVPLVIYGNQFLPRKPIDMLKTMDFKQNFSMLSGFTENEGGIFLMLNNMTVWNPTDPMPLTKAAAADLLRSYTSLIKTNQPINADDVIDIYLSQIPENNTDLLRQSIGTAVGDFYLTCNSNLFNRYVYSADPTHNKVFQYLFAANSRNTHFWCSKTTGSCHGSDMYMFLGHAMRYPERYTPEEMSFSKSMINTFTHFAKYDKPPAQEGIEWSSFHRIKNTEDILQPYYRFLLKARPEGNFGFNYKDFECGKLWRPHIEDQ